MRESNVMKELRKIRDANSKRHLKMTREERNAEAKNSYKRFLEVTSRLDDISKKNNKNHNNNYNDINEMTISVNEDTSEYNEK